MGTIERRLIDANLLDDIELNWLNDYHADVWEKLNGLVDAETKVWLEKACAPIER